MSGIFEGSALTELLRSGVKARRATTYYMWVWAREGSGIQMELNGSRLEASHLQTPPNHRPGWMVWVRVGAVSVNQGQALRPSVVSDSDKYLAALALAPSKGFDPRRDAEISRIFLDQPGPVRDERLLDIKSVYTPWTLRHYNTRRTWEDRVVQIRRHILVCLGLWPLPVKGPLKARLSGRIEREDYTVEKVYFESVPGYYVCGNLYRPLGKGPFPAIVNPHGHWRHGRLENSELGSIPGRCINLARRGFVALSYDMAGYCDSRQVDHAKFGGPREDLWGIGLMGLQLWNSIRAVDFLCSLEDVDAGRIGCTGASGGGTQTFMLTAVDERVRAAAPVVMISAHMQGGCICENQAHLRLDVNNVEIASMTAPRPLLIVSCTGDWTVDTPNLEYPAVRDVYQLYGAQERVSQVQVDAPHNYNRASREAVYAFFERWLAAGDGKQRPEQDFVVEPKEDLLVFSGRALPSDALDSHGIVGSLIARAEQTIAEFRPRDPAALTRLRQVLGPALKDVLSAGMPNPADLYVRNMGRTGRTGFIVQRLLLGRKQAGERVPAVFFLPASTCRPKAATLVVHSDGKAALSDRLRGRPGKEITSLLEQGHQVLTIDPFLTGEFHGPRNVSQRCEETAHFTTYNPTVASCRVQDVLTALVYLQTFGDVDQVNLLGLGKAGLWCILARVLAPAVKRTAIDFSRFKGDDGSWLEDCAIPGVRAVGDLRTALCLVAPAELLVYNSGKTFPKDWAQEAYRAEGKVRQLRVEDGRLAWLDVCAWLTRK